MSQRSVSRSPVGTICLWLLVGVLFTSGVLSPAGMASAERGTSIKGPAHPLA